MSTTQRKISKENPISVIIRGFRERPAVLEAVEIRGTAVDVVGEDPDMPMPFHLDRAFEFDESLYAQLSQAYESQDGTLNELWSHAVPFR